jgi:predicted dehydrogenase
MPPEVSNLATSPSNLAALPKVALIGAGNWGKNLARNFHELGVLAAIAEPSESLRENLAKDYPDTAIHTSYEPILTDTSIDAVAIATPVPTHHAVASAAIAAGKDVFVEKPMTLTSADARDLVQKAEAADRILMVGHLLLYQPAIQCIKAYLDEGKLGKIYSVHQERVKLGRARAVENVTWSLGVHDLAVLLYLVGQSPTSLQGSGHSALTPGVEDDVYVHMNFPSGCKGHLHNSWLWPENRRYLTIVGEKGMLVHHEMQGEVVLYSKTIDSELQNQDQGTETVFNADDQQPLRLELQHFLECIGNRTRPISDGHNGLEVIQALERIEMS